MTYESWRGLRHILSPETRVFWLFFALVLAQNTVFSAIPEDIPVDFPRVQLPAKVRGQEAVNALGNQLPAVAAYYRMSAAELRGRLLRDRDLWVNQWGRL